MISPMDALSLEPPESWRVLPFWSLFRREKQVGFPEEELLSVYRDHGVVPTASRDDNNNNPSEDLSGYQLVTEGSLVTNKMKAWQGSISISRFRGIVSPAYYVYQPLSGEYDQFLHYLLRSKPYIALYQRISKGVRVNQWDLEHEALRTIPILLPDLHEQKKIAEFLDSETARIDDLITKKERFIELLAEREENFVRNLLGGEMTACDERRSSQSLWLNNVPNHWDVVPLRHLVTIQTGSRDTQNRIDDGEYPFFVRSMSVERINSFSFDGEAVLTSGDGAGVGKVFHYVNCKFDLHQRMYAFTGFKRVTGRYFYFFLKTFFKLQMTQWSAKSTVDSVRMPFLKSLQVTVPPSDEQMLLVEAIEKREKRDSQIKVKTDASILRLREYRTALITAAVTGQIDVARYGRSGTTAASLDRIEESMSS
jgi:type I restriction enzyme S subunit